jgi:hypothetical protein
MTDWETYRNGNPREIWNLERLARHRAAKLGYRLHRSRRRKGRDNAGDFMLLHKKSSTVLLGAGYTAILEMILEFVERERTALVDAPHRPTQKTRFTSRRGSLRRLARPRASREAFWRATGRTLEDQAVAAT